MVRSQTLLDCAVWPARHACSPLLARGHQYPLCCSVVTYGPSSPPDFSSFGPQCGSLPIALAARGHRVMVVSPGYRDFDARQSDVRIPPSLETKGVSN